MIARLARHGGHALFRSITMYENRYTLCYNKRGVYMYKNRKLCETGRFAIVKIQRQLQKRRSPRSNEIARTFIMYLMVSQNKKGQFSRFTIFLYRRARPKSINYLHLGIVFRDRHAFLTDCLVLNLEPYF